LQKALSLRSHDTSYAVRKSNLWLEGEMAWEEDLFERTDRFVQGFETLKRKPHERPRGEIDSRRLWKIQNVTRVRRNPEDGNA